MMKTQGLDFTFNGLAVGYFESDLSECKGEFRYMPYRGPGHYDVAVQLNSGLSSNCEVTVEGKVYQFRVTGPVDYGLLTYDELHEASEAGDHD